jgi:hypothetical protein
MCQLASAGTSVAREVRLGRSTRSSSSSRKGTRIQELGGALHGGRLLELLELLPTV